MLRVDLRALREGPFETRAEVPATDPLLSGLEFALAGPITVRGRLTESGPGSYFWHAELRTAVTLECRRCLTPVRVEVETDVQALLTEGDTGDDPSAYAIPARVQDVELGEVVREELLLAVPRYVLCREDCRGLCAQCGKDLNEGPCACRPEADPRWAALEALKTQAPDKER